MSRNPPHTFQHRTDPGPEITSWSLCNKLPRLGSPFEIGFRRTPNPGRWRLDWYNWISRLFLYFFNRQGPLLAPVIKVIWSQFWKAINRDKKNLIYIVVIITTNVPFFIIFFYCFVLHEGVLQRKLTFLTHTFLLYSPCSEVVVAIIIIIIGPLSFRGRKRSGNFANLQEVCDESRKTKCEEGE